MPKYSLIVQLGIRELTVNIRGIDVTVTQRLDKDPKEAQAVRARVLAGKKDICELLARKKANKGKASTSDQEDAEIEALESMVNQLEFALEADDRMT